MMLIQEPETLGATQALDEEFGAIDGRVRVLEDDRKAWLKEGEPFCRCVRVGVVFSLTLIVALLLGVVAVSIGMPIHSAKQESLLVHGSEHGSGRSSCASGCHPGSFCDAEQGICVNCPSGSVSQKSNSTKCQKCAAGTTVACETRSAWKLIVLVKQVMSRTDTGAVAGNVHLGHILMKDFIAFNARPTRWHLYRALLNAISVLSVIFPAGGT